jgi:2-methylcitrate dehydratase PrpD
MTKRRIFLAALVMQGVAAVPALSAEAAAVCQNSGRDYKVGEYACIPACHGQRRLARCDSVTQSQSATATWTYVSDVCPSAMLPPAPSDATARPIRAAMTPIPLPIEHTMSEMSPEAWMRLATLMKANASQ